jgi:hypothetical protein
MRTKNAITVKRFNSNTQITTPYDLFTSVDNNPCPCDILDNYYKNRITEYKENEYKIDGNRIRNHGNSRVSYTIENVEPMFQRISPNISSIFIKYTVSNTDFKGENKIVFEQTVRNINNKDVIQNGNFF